MGTCLSIAYTVGHTIYLTFTFVKNYMLVDCKQMTYTLLCNIHVIGFKLVHGKQVKSIQLHKHLLTEAELQTSDDVLRSSDIAEGMQCVAKISAVAALAVSVRRTTFCPKKHIDQLLTAFSCDASRDGFCKRDKDAVKRKLIRSLIMV